MAYKTHTGICETSNKTRKFLVEARFRGHPYWSAVELLGIFWSSPVLWMEFIITSYFQLLLCSFDSIPLQTMTSGVILSIFWKRPEFQCYAFNMCVYD